MPVIIMDLRNGCFTVGSIQGQDYLKARFIRIDGLVYQNGWWKGIRKCEVKKLSRNNEYIVRRINPGRIRS